MLQRRTSPAVAGSFFGGAVSGAAVSTVLLMVAAGLLSPLPLRVRAIAAIIGISVIALHALGIISLRLPQNARQIPEHAFAVAPRTAAFRFAFELGTAVRTYITKNAVYAIAIVFVLLSPRGLASAAWAGFLLAVGFGFGRSIIVIGHTWRSRAITTHPNWALQAANATTIAVCVVVAVGELVR